MYVIGKLILRNKFVFFSTLINYLLQYSILGTSNSMFKQAFDTTLDADLIDHLASRIRIVGIWPALAYKKNN